MKEFKNDVLTILNYQGSKKNLLNFIFDNTSKYINPDKAVLDICSGTCSVGYSMKRYYTVYANDSELYASIIAESLLNFDKKIKWEDIEDIFENNYKLNKSNLENIFGDYLNRENKCIEELESKALIDLYKDFPVIWSGKEFNYFENKVKTIEDLRRYKKEVPYMLFTTYYSTTYFGIKQSIEIDSIRYAIEFIENNSLRNMLYSSLYFSMKECVFSKDGHMAQPLDIVSNESKLIRSREKSIYKRFMAKINEFYSDEFIVSNKDNKVFNLEMKKVIDLDEIKNNVGFIYADPPYTDMQYSRYYHLLNTVTLYDYDKISSNKGNLTKGLYRETRYQSPLSQKSKAADYIKELFEFCSHNSINLGFSFAYPRDPEIQPTNRYTMDINTIINMAKDSFGEDNVEVITEEYQHSNNRNSSTKKVLEYLILCKG